MTRDYIEYRLEKVGRVEPLFEEDTFAVIHQATGGVPRLINLLCDTALLYGFAEEKNTIDLAVVEQVVKDKEYSFSPIGKKNPAISTLTRLKNGEIAPVPGTTAGNDAETDKPDRPLTTVERAALKLKDS